MAQNRQGNETDALIVPLIIVGGAIILVLFVFIPLVMALVAGHDLLSTVRIAWLVFPSASLLASWIDWRRGRRSRATIDVLVVCGVASSWLFIIAADVGGELLGPDLGLWPMLIVILILLFTAGSFIALVKTLPGDEELSSTSPGMRGFFLTLSGASLLAMLLAYVLALYFQVMV